MHRGYLCPVEGWGREERASKRRDRVERASKRRDRVRGCGWGGGRALSEIDEDLSSNC